MKTLLLASVIGLTFVASSASAALNTEETSVWKRIRYTPIENVEKAAEEPKSQVWKRIRYSKVDVTKTETSKVWKRIRY